MSVVPILFISAGCGILDTPTPRTSERPDKYEEQVHMPKALSLYREGDNVYIHRINGNGAFKKRLNELGFRRGKYLSIVKYAPLKDPMEVELGGYHVSLRVEEADRIQVDTEAPQLQ